MTQAQQPEAIKLASEYRETMPADVLHLWARDAVGALRRLHEEAVDLRVLATSLLNKNGGLQLAFLTAQEANNALQARVQELEAERDRFRDALHEWIDKTDWVQESSQAHELGKHRADVLRERIVRVQRELDAALEVMEVNAKSGAAWAARVQELEGQLESIGAGGVEPLRKTNPLEICGIKTHHGQLLRAALQEAEAALEVALARILKRDPGHSVNVTSEAKALVIVRNALDESNHPDHFPGATEMVPDQFRGATKMTQDAGHEQKTLEQDAARYRWLRWPKLHTGHGSIQVTVDDRGNTGNLSKSIFLEELDNTIDAAREEGGAA